MTGQGLDHYQKLDVDKQDNDDALRAVYDEWAKEYDHDGPTFVVILKPALV